MELSNKTIVVTGAASGIGAAIAKQFAAAGSRVVVADLDAEASAKTALEFNGLGVACDVTDEQQIKALVSAAEAHFGPVDLFCSNAGICVGEPNLATSASNADWQLCWELHVMAHVYAARAVLPSMIERGSGYFVQIASAAGLLSQIGDAAYSATKHAAVGFAESLAITHGDDGIKVSVVCPSYVATPMLGYNLTKSGPTPESPGMVPGLISAEQVAAAVLDGVTNDRFMVLPHPQVEKFHQAKAGNYDRWIGGMRGLRAKIVDEIGTTELAQMHKLV